MSVSTVYDFTEEGYDEYLQTLPAFLTEPQLAEFMATGYLKRVSTEDGSTATTIHEKLPEL